MLLFNPKYRVSRRFEGEISQIRMYRYVKEWSNHWNLSKRTSSGPEPLLQPEVPGPLKAPRSPTTLQRDLARCTSVSHPTNLAVGRDKPALPLAFDECHRS